MSSRWPAGELLHGAIALRNIYQSLPDGAKTEPRQFKREFEIVVQHLSQLSELEKRLSQNVGELEDATASNIAELGHGYQETIERFARFIDRQKNLLTGDRWKSTAPMPTSIPRNQAKRLRPTTAAEEVEWQTELTEIELFRQQFERYTQIANLRISASRRGRPHYQTRIPIEMILAKLKVLQVIKELTKRVLTFLKRCLIEQYNANDAKTYQSQRQARYRALFKLVDPSPKSTVELWSNGVNIKPRKLKHLSKLASNSIQPVDLLHKYLRIMAYLVVRRDLCGLSRPSAFSLEDRQYPINIVHRTRSDRSFASILEFVETIYHLINENLIGLGYKANIVSVKASIKVANHRADTSVQVLTNTIENWSDLNIRVNYLMMHCDVPLAPSSLISIAPTSPSQTTRPGSTFSLPYHTYFPYSHETFPSTTGFRRTSYASHQAANRASVSTLSSVDLGTPWDIVRATLGLVKVEFSGTIDQHPHLNIRCSVDIVSHPNSGEVVSIVALREDMPGTVRHTIHENKSLTTESSFIPYLDNRHVHGDNNELYRLHFRGAHKIEIEENWQVRTYVTRPIYICRDREDYLSFQSGLLKKDVRFIAEIVNILSNSEEHISGEETVRVLEDKGNGRRSILFYASNRGLNRIAGFMEWPVNAFQSVKKRLGTAGIEIRLTKSAIESRRRETGSPQVEQFESQTSFFSGLDGGSDSLGEIKSLEFHFYETKDRDDFREWLDE